MHCDRHRHQPIGASPFRSGKAPGIRPYPAVAMICEYEFWPYQNRPARLTGQVTLGAQAADGLAAIVDSARRVHLEPSSCGGDLARHSHAVVILFGYAGSHVISAAVHQPYCNDVGNILTGGRSFRVPWPVLDALMAPATNSVGNNGPAAPQLTGLSLAAATAAARRRGQAIQLSGVIADSRAPLGSVIYQGVPAGAATRLRNGPAVRVIVAARTARSCTPDQLRLSYRGNGDFRGSDWGSVVISNVGQEPCGLPGTVRITGIDQAGGPVTTTYTSRLDGGIYTASTTAPLILSPRMASVPDGLAAPYGFPPPPGGLAAAIRLEARYGPASSSPTGSSCRHSWVVPADWRVVIGGVSRTVPNADLADPDPIVPSGGFVICGGNLYAALSYYGLLTY
jgi:hypothetical protein